MRAVTHIMNDDLEAAEAGLTNGNSSFHKVHSMFPAYCLNYGLMVAIREERWLMRMLVGI